MSTCHGGEVRGKLARIIFLLQPSWAQGIKVRMSELASSTFTPLLYHWTILLALKYVSFSDNQKSQMDTYVIVEYIYFIYSAV